MGKIGFRTLRMVESPVTHTAPRGPDGEAPTVEKIARAVAVLGSFVDNLKREGTCHSDSFLHSTYPKSMPLDLQMHFHCNCEHHHEATGAEGKAGMGGKSRYLNTQGPRCLSQQSRRHLPDQRRGRYSRQTGFPQWP